MRIDALGIRMNDGTPDAEGAYWYVDKLDGWAFPTLRQSFGDKTGQHGVAMLETLFGARTFSITGICKTSDETVFWNRYNSLIALCSDFDTYFYLDVYETTPKRANVQIGGELKIEIKNGHFIFELPLVATDPFKYSLTQKSSSLPSGATLVLSTDGSKKSYPTITTTGPVIYVKNVTTGEDFKATGLSGTSVYDFIKKNGYSNLNTNIFGKIDLAVSEWLSISPGAGDTFTNLGGVGMTIAYRDTWS